MEQKSIVVALAMIEQDGKLLLAQRRSDVFLEPDKWGFPGGKLEFGEHPEKTMVREIQEELGVEAEVEKLLCVHSNVFTVKTTAVHTVVLVYKVNIVSGQPRALDDQKIEWVAKEEIRTYDLVAGNDRILDMCLGSSVG